MIFLWIVFKKSALQYGATLLVDNTRLLKKRRRNDCDFRSQTILRRYHIK